jgi:type III restriction protein res subunit
LESKFCLTEVQEWMNQKALINDRKYAFLEHLPSLDEKKAMILCVNERGEKYVCSEELWCSSASPAEQTAPIHAHSSAHEKIEFFLSVFKGRENLYAKRYYSTKTGKTGYTPVCRNEWVPGLCDKRERRCPDCPNREFLPLTAEVVKAHLIGQDPLCQDVVAIYPMLEDNTTWLLAADFDEENWQADVAAFCKCCREIGLTPAVERSRSGNGAHVWLFFSNPVPAADARRLGSGLLTQTMACRHELSFASYDRLFPSQDIIPKGGFGNLIALPFQGQAQKNGNSLFVDERLVPYPDQWAFLSSLPKISPEQLTECLQRLCRDGETTAFGKTVIGAYLIGQRKTNTLILVQSSTLLEQWKSSLEQFLDIHEVLPEPPKKRGRKRKIHLIGQIGAGKNTRSGIIDIAIMQSLFEGEEKTVKSFVSEYGMVIVDECHHVAAFTFESVLKSVEAKYVYGLSATPVRKDGHHPIIFMQCGPVRYLVDAKSQAEKRAFTHFVIPRFTRTRLPSVAGIQDLYAGVTENDNRNALLAADTLKLVREGRTPILLTERKEHAAQLAALLEGKVHHVFLLIGSDKQKDKREKIAALQAVPTDEDIVVIATGKYIGEGFDFPRLDTLLLVMPISWKGTLAQYAGRLHRNYEGKHEVRIYDYVDVHVPTLDRMYHKRLKGYAELGYQVKFGERDDSVSMIYDGYASMAPFFQDLSDAAKNVVIVSPYIQKGRVSKLLPTLQERLLSGVEVVIYVKDADNFDSKYQSDIREAVAMLEQIGVTVIKHKELQQRYAVIDESVVWYGSVDFLAFGRKDTDVLRFENADIAGELLELSQETGGEQLMIADGLI